MNLAKSQIIQLLNDEVNQAELFKNADNIRKLNVGNEVHLRGLIEFSNICRNNCLYCGIRKDNRKICRYHMEPEELIDTARKATALGFKTMVMQSVKLQRNTLLK